MKMYFDKFSKIGSDHKENEDYAVIGDEEHPFVIVSDGCSGSRDTSTGSRLLSLCAAKFLIDLNYYGIFFDQNDIGNIIIEHSFGISNLLKLPQECLDATLIICCIDRSEYLVNIYMWGDGVVYYKYKNGEYSFYSVDYTPELPYYLSYSLNTKNNENYCRLSSGGKITKIECNGGVSSYVTALDHTQLSISLRDLEYVLISTDGASSFINKDNKPISEKTIDDEINSFKRLNGEFLGRRMNRMIKNLAKEGINHYDDFTVAGISFVDN